MRELKLICKKGNLDDIKKIINDDNIDYIFRYSCKCGHLGVAKYLININKNMHDNYKYAFKQSCGKGKLVVAKWLYSLCDINIHVREEYVFKLSCEKWSFEGR